VYECHNNNIITKFLGHPVIKMEPKFENGYIRVDGWWFNCVFCHRHNSVSPSPSRLQWTRPYHMQVMTNDCLGVHRWWLNILLLLLLLLLLLSVRHCLYGGTNVLKRWGILPDSESRGIRLSLVVVDSHLLTGAPLEGGCRCPERAMLTNDDDKLSSCSRFSDSVVGFTSQKIQPTASKYWRK